MAIRLLRYDGDPILKKRSKEIPEVTKRIKNLAQDMIDTLEKEDGVGLAGPQVGVLKRIIIVYFDPDVDSEEEVIEDFEVFRDGPIVAVNPEILESEGELTEYEGCLSFPNLSGKVTRPEEVKVSYTNLDGERVTETHRGMIARCFCHEIDHLNGKVFIDQVQDGTLVNLEELENSES